jgi:hypothetical protein
VSIRKDDAVMIVWACCPRARSILIGKVFTVADIATQPNLCIDCHRFDQRTVAINATGPTPGEPWTVPVEWLIKMPPPADERELDPVTVPRETVDA